MWRSGKLKNEKEKTRLEKKYELGDKGFMFVEEQLKGIGDLSAAK